MAALSSYARNPGPFVREGSSPAVDRAFEHLTRALDLETDPGLRVNLLYRQAMIAVRNRDEFEEGLRLCHEAVESAGHVQSGSRSAFLAGRSLAGRSLAQYRLGNLREAADDCEKALDALKGVTDTTEVPATELQVAELVLSDNLARVCFSAGRRAQTQALHARCRVLAEALPRWRKPHFVHSLLEGAEFNLATAIDHLTERLEFARQEWDIVMTSTVSYHLGNLHYRQGDAATAHGYYDTAFLQWRRIGQDAVDLLGAEQNRAICALRARWLDAAEADFERVRANPRVKTLRRKPRSWRRSRWSRHIVAIPRLPINERAPPWKPPAKPTPQRSPFVSTAWLPSRGCVSSASTTRDACLAKRATSRLRRCRTTAPPKSRRKIFLGSCPSSAS